MPSKNNPSFLFFMKVSSAVCSILLCFLLLSCDSTPKTKATPEKKTPPVDLTTHPVYSKYQFNLDDNTIDFGFQPLALPTGVLTEVMRHDQILNTSLADAGLSLQWHPFYKGKDINFFMKRGDIEFAVAGDMPTLTGAVQDYAVAVALVKQNFSVIIPESVLSEGGQIFNEFHFLKNTGRIDPEKSWSQTLHNFDRQIMTEVLT